MTRGAEAPPRPSTRRHVLGWLAAASVSAALGCAPKARAERVAEFPLETSTRYAWITDEPVLIQLGEPQANVRTEANELRLRAAIDAALAKRGFQAVSRDEAQVLVAFSVGTTVRYRLEGSTSGSIAGLEPGEKQTKGTLNLYLVDHASRREVWHGWTSKWLSKGDDPDATVHEAVETVMSAFPGAR